MLEGLVGVALLIGFILIVVGLVIEKETLSFVGFGLIFVSFIAGLMLGYTTKDSIDAGSFTIGYWFHKLMY